MCHHFWKSKLSSGQQHKMLCSNLWIYKAAVSPAGCWQNSWCGRIEPLDWMSGSIRKTWVKYLTLHEPGTVSLKCTIQRYFNSRIQTISRGYLLRDAHQQNHFGWNTYIKMSRPGFPSQNESWWIMKQNFESLIKQYLTRSCVLKWFFHS